LLFNPFVEMLESDITKKFLAIDVALECKTVVLG
jgi:hypothetical protein